MGFSEGVDRIKQAAEIAFQLKNVDLQERLVALCFEVVNLGEEVLRLREENSSLKDRLRVKDELVRGKDAYWRRRPDGGLEGPYCTSCWDARSTLVWMVAVGASLDFVQCPACKIQMKLPVPPP